MANVARARPGPSRGRTLARRLHRSYDHGAAHAGKKTCENPYEHGRFETKHGQAALGEGFWRVIANGVIVCVLFVVVSGLHGTHGPSQNMPAGYPGGHSLRRQLLVLGVLAIAGVALNWSWLVGTRAGQLTWRLGERSLSRWRWPAMPSRLRKFALTLHVCSSVSFLGAVACFLDRALTGLMSREAQTVTAAYVAMDAITIAVVVPLSVAALLTGLFQSLGTRWGLFRHYWVLVKFLLILLTTIVLL